jgi:hypothetical protein
MSSSVKALLIFCEGPHDAAFVRMVFKKILGFRIEKLKFSEMPSPFNALFSTAVQNHAAQDMSLDMTHKFFLPDSVLRKNEEMAFIFNCGGKTQYDKVRDLLSDYIPLIEQAAIFPNGAEEIVDSVRYLFLYDSDADGLDHTIDNISREFQKVDEKDFVVDAWIDTKSEFGRISNDKAVFVWGGAPDMGTLEDILMPMFDFTEANKPLIARSKQTMNEMFRWDIDHTDSMRAVAEIEKFKKAVLTTVGQRKKPGASLNVILEQADLISDDALRACPITAGFVEFVREFWRMAD